MITIGPYRLSDFWHAFLRRFWILVLSVGLIAPAALAIAYFLPSQYRSGALILVESQQISLVESTVTVSASERLQRIRQKLMTRDNLLDMINKFGLYAERTDLSPTDKVVLVRDNTAINPTTLPGTRANPGALLSFTIAYTTNNPRLAAQVVNEFVAKIISENVRSRTERATGTLSYFREEVDTLSSELAEIEAQMTRFQSENAEVLPGNVQALRDELTIIQQREFQRAQTRLALVEQKRTLEDGLLTGRIGALNARQMSQEEQALRALRNTLIQRQAVLAESHPEIVAIKKRIEALEQVVAPGQAPGEPVRSPAEQQAVDQVAQIGKQIALLDSQQEADAARKAEVVALISRAPEVAMEINRLTRKQTQLQTQYDASAQRMAAAREGAELEDKRQAERFEVAEPPQVPEVPFAPNRTLIAAGGVAFSVFFGLGLMVLLELLNSSIRTAHALEYRTGLKPVVTIPYIRTKGERRRRLARWLVLLLVLATAIPAVLWAVDQFYLPLGALAEKVSERLGLDAIIRIVEIRLGR